MLHSNYINPRIEFEDLANGDAEHGEVTFSFSAFLWLVPMLLIGTLGSALTVSVGAVVLFVITTLITLCFGHSLGMHRRFIHRSYRCPRWMELMFLHLGTLVGLAGPIGMLTTHDLRDWAQRQACCHPFLCHDGGWMKDLYWQLLCNIKLSNPPLISIENDILNDPWVRWIERTWMLQQLPWAVLFYVLGGWGWVCWGICSRVSVGVVGHWLIGYLAHNKGHRHWHVKNVAVQGHDIPWTSLLTMGECWHNNHHAFPYSAKLGLFKGQWDPGWEVLKLLEKAGLVSDLCVPDLVTLRPELEWYTPNPISD